MLKTMSPNIEAAPCIEMFVPLDRIEIMDIKITN